MSKILPRKSDDISKDKTFIRDTPTYKIHSPEEIKVYDIYHYIICEEYITLFRNITLSRTRGRLTISQKKAMSI